MEDGRREERKRGLVLGGGFHVLDDHLETGAVVPGSGLQREGEIDYVAAIELVNQLTLTEPDRFAPGLIRFDLHLQVRGILTDCVDPI